MTGNRPSTVAAFFSDLSTMASASGLGYPTESRIKKRSS